MAVPTFTGLLIERNIATQSSYTTVGSTSPTALRLAIAFIYNVVVGVVAETPTLTGGGVNGWTQIGTTLAANNVRRMTAFCGLTGSTPGSGQLVSSFNGQTQNKYAISVVSVDNSSMEGSNGIDTIARSVGANTASSAATHTLTATGSWSHADNRFLAGWGTNANRTMIAQSPFTDVHVVAGADIAAIAISGRDADLHTITVGIVSGSNTSFDGYALEIKGLTATPTPFAYPPMRTIGLNKRLN